MTTPPPPHPPPATAQVLVAEDGDGHAIVAALVVALPCGRTGVLLDRWGSVRTIGLHPDLPLLLAEGCAGG